jgi:hypothetical protein
LAIFPEELNQLRCELHARAIDFVAAIDGIIQAAGHRFTGCGGKASQAGNDGDTKKKVPHGSNSVGAA